MNIEYLNTEQDEKLYYGNVDSEGEYIDPKKYYTMMDYLLESDTSFKEYYANMALESDNFQFWK